MTTPTKLFNKNFFLLWQGQFVSQLGSQVHYIAMMFWLKHVSSSAGLMGLLMMLSMIPGVVLGPIGGTIADRYSRRRIIIFSDIICGVAVLSLAGLLLYDPDNEAIAIPWLFAVSIIIGIVGGFFRPAISAAIPDLVPREKIAAANSLNQSSVQVSSFVGQGFGGVLFRVFGAPLLFLVNGITYLFSAFSEYFIEIPQTIPERSTGWKAIMRDFIDDTKVGFRYVWHNRGMRAVFFTATFLNFLVSPIAVLFPFYIEDHLGVTPDWFGYLLAAMGAGSLIGYAVAGSLKISGRVRSRMLIVFLSIMGVQFGALGLSNSPVLSLALTLTMGMLSGVVNISIITVLQLTTPSEIRGRVFGLLGTIIGGLMPLGMGLAGVVMEMLDNNVALIFIVCGAVMALINIAMAFNRHYRVFLACDIEQTNNTHKEEHDNGQDNLTADR
ncbi:MAG: MFS transporter [candidate division Zixibacteria bacterium]|nr:MFS transporter [candidate division Zixibacteria bacterium]